MYQVHPNEANQCVNKLNSSQAGQLCMMAQRRLFPLLCVPKRTGFREPISQWTNYSSWKSCSQFSKTQLPVHIVKHRLIENFPSIIPMNKQENSPLRVIKNQAVSLKVKTLSKQKKQSYIYLMTSRIEFTLPSQGLSAYNQQLQNGTDCLSKFLHPDLDVKLYRALQLRIRQETRERFHCLTWSLEKSAEEYFEGRIFIARLRSYT